MLKYLQKIYNNCTPIVIFGLFSRKGPLMSGNDVKWNFSNLMSGDDIKHKHSGIATSDEIGWKLPGKKKEDDLKWGIPKSKLGIDGTGGSPVVKSAGDVKRRFSPKVPKVEDDRNWMFPVSNESKWGVKTSLKMERCLLGKQELSLPEVLLDQPHIFKDVLSVDTWSNILTDAQKTHLTKYLPKFPENDKKEKEETVRRLFEGDNFKFGNPLTQFHTKLKDLVQRSKKQLFKSLCPIPSPEPTHPSVVSTFAAKPTVNGDISSSLPTTPVPGDDGNPIQQPKRQRPFSPVEVTEEDYVQMIRNHKRRKHDVEMYPELNTQNISLQDIMSRCQAARKTPQNGNAPISKKKKIKLKDRNDKKLKKSVKIKSEDIRQESQSSAQSNSQFADAENSTGLQDNFMKQEDEVPDFPLPETCPPKLTFGQHDNFFSLVRDLLCGFSDGRATTVKFLSGDLIGGIPDNFVPFVDYKERAQQWRWIGAGRDSDDKLNNLCKQWLANKKDKTSDSGDLGQGSPPPPRARTSFVVRATTEEEKLMFREQEKRRFENPHKGFTYKMHGYESVVGPVKGVYTKENAMTKAREHAIEVKLTQLLRNHSDIRYKCIMRDAAARLPNGEGTRGDICELLKDSQFLAPDRLHSEKDPCVKYDVNRKLWIYLHRSRTEEEFERIHQAHGAAQRAKKSLQKPKTPKAKAKETNQATQPTSTIVSPKLTTSLSVSSDSISIEDQTPLSLTPSSPSVTNSPKKTPNSPALGTVSPHVTSISPRTSALASIATTLKRVQSPNPSSSPAISSSLPRQETATGIAKTLPLGLLQSIRMTVAGSNPAISQTLSQNLAAAIRPELFQRQGSVISTTNPQSPAGTPTSASPVISKVITSQPQSPVVTSNTVQNVSATTGVTTPLVARLVQQMPAGSQISVSNLLAAQRAQMQAQSQTKMSSTVHIKGNATSATANPVQLTGKPLATTARGQLVQIAGKGQQQMGLIQTQQGALPTISIIPQAGGTAGVMNITQPRTPTSAIAEMSVRTGSPSPLTTATTTIARTAHQTQVIMTTTASSTGLTQQTASQQKVVTPSQGGIVVTQLAPGSITLRPGGTPASSHAKVVTAGQAGLLPAQFIVQQTADLMTGGNTTVTQSLASGTQLLVSGGAGKPGQNIQVVRTVLGQQAGLKPGQATILISQPPLQQTTASMMSTGQVIQNIPKTHGKGSQKTKQPVYARIITPPPGMKLATVGAAAGQALQAAPNVNVLQTAVNKLISVPTIAGTQTSGTVVLSDPQVTATDTTQSLVTLTTSSTSQPSGES
ncbi:hypothetical protein KUTeg_024541 [Tegillarca granosa]|uniref:DEUBAD domain-containing protein n=1 Tax=Tegillarca granosa TaxID=220873 RepID=A0ABQ9DYN3_TEGGR|nr:hypothetical protein KUTeg_024541 [Tegillarca granosa]